MELRLRCPRLQGAVLVALLVFPLIYADIYYRDDATRALKGIASWGWLGRPLADALMYAASMSSGWLSNISPLPQILAGVLLYMTCLSVSRTVFGRESSLGVISTFAALGTPFALECLLYRYDSLPMMLALYLAALSFSLVEKGWPWILASVALLVASLSLYQAQSNLFICLAVIGFGASVLSGDGKAVRSAITHGLAYLAAMSIYYIAVFKVFAKTSRDGSIDASNNGLALLLENFSSFLLSIETVLAQPAYFASIIVLFAAAAASCAIDASRTKAYICTTKVLVFTSIPAFLILASIGPLITLKEGFSSYRLMGSAFVVVVFLSYIAGRNERLVKLTFVSVALLAIANVSSAFSIGAAARDQRSYEEAILQNISAKIDAKWDRYEGKKVYLVGSFEPSPMTIRRNTSAKMTNTLVTPSPYWVSSRLLLQRGVKNVDTGWANPEGIVAAMKCDELGPADVGSMYKIFPTKDKIFVVIGHRELQCKRSQ